MWAPARWRQPQILRLRLRMTTVMRELQRSEFSRASMRAFLVVVGVGGLFDLGGWMLGEFGQRELDRFLQLRVAALAHQLGILFNGVVGLDAVVLHVPLACGREKRYAGGRNVAAIHEHRNGADA